VGGDHASTPTVPEPSEASLGQADLCQVYQPLPADSTARHGVSRPSDELRRLRDRWVVQVLEVTLLPDTTRAYERLVVVQRLADRGVGVVDLPVGLDVVVLHQGHGHAQLQSAVVAAGIDDGDGLELVDLDLREAVRLELLRQVLLDQVERT